MSDKTYVLSLSADTFNAFKMDFDSALQRLLQKMDRLQSDSASINCKISVALTPAPERNFDATQEGDTVQVMKPSFSHEISTEIKVKDKTTGNLSGNRKLVWDEELMEYVMKDIDDGQTSLFDTAQNRQNAAPPVEQEPPQLPEGIVDVDYTVISDDKGYILRNPDKCGIKDQWGILKVLVGERMTVSRSAGHCYAAHQCRETSDALKQFWQIKYMMAHKASVADFRAAFGKNYLELDYYDDERSYPMNIIAISGRLTRDPELRTTPNGKPVVEFTVAVDRPGVKDQTDFIDCVAWEKKAEFVARYFKQGKRIEASGVLTTRTYEKNGVKRKRTEVRCDQVFFGESKKGSGSTPQAAPEPTNDDFRPLPDDDDIPF